VIRNVIYFHVIPFAVALLLSIALIVSQLQTPTENKILIEGSQELSKGRIANLAGGNQAEVNFMTSIANTDQLTIFGSSEFSSSPYCSYNFLPDSLGIPAMGIGHAYHQSFSILCELLASDEYVDSSRIVVVLSPGWFMTEGTNTAAFIEFVRPNLLSRIVDSEKVDQVYKEHVGEYITEHYDGIDGLSYAMKELVSVYDLSKESLFQRAQSKCLSSLVYNYTKNIVQYDFTLDVNNYSRLPVNFQEVQGRLKEVFKLKVSNNNIWVYDEYYSRYLVNKDGDEKVGEITGVRVPAGSELDDFRLLVKYLKQKHTKCSFIIQPLNPYYYPGLNKMTELIDTLEGTLDRNNIPYLNMFVSAKKDYTPGTLNDVMHLGDYGWMEINHFLNDLYHDK
jgi:poly-D-alanine transfer protein DltD